MTDAPSVPAVRPPLQAGGQVAALVPQTLDEAYRLSQAIASSGLTPKGITTPEQVMVAIIAGAELGLPPFQSLQSFAIINGRPTLWGDAIPAILWSHGFKIKEWMENSGPEYPNEMVAKCLVTRPDGTEIEGEFSVGDAKEAKLWSKDGPWQTSKKRMMKMRARAFAARDGAADVLRGRQIAEEVQDYVVIEERAVGKKKSDLVGKLATRGDATPSEGFSQAHVDAHTATQAEENEVVDEQTGEITSGPQTDAASATTASGKSASTPTGSPAAASDQAGPGQAATTPASPSEDDSFPGDRDIERMNKEAAAKRADELQRTQSGGTGSIDRDPRPTGEGTPAKDEVYWYIEDTSGANDGKWPTYKNGEPEGRANIATGKKLKVYFDHYEPEDADSAEDGAQHPQTGSARPAEAAQASSGSATAASTASAAATSGQAAPATRSSAGAPADTFDFGEFFEAMGQTTSWLQLKPTIAALKRSAEWPLLEEEERAATHRKIWGHVLFLREKGDPVSSQNDISAFRIWIDTEDSISEVEGRFRMLMREPVWAKAAEQAKAVITAAVEAKVAALRLKS